MFTLILGPMKSGKSLELLTRMAPYKYTGQQVLYVQPKSNTRDTGIRSRSGMNIDAVVVESLRKITDPFDVIGIDEIHMFGTTDVRVIEKWINEDKSLFISGLDLDYRGKMPAIVNKLLELKPDKLIHKLSVCDNCKQFRAQFTQILHNDQPVLAGLPTVVPEDGTYQYEARCRQCFVKA